MRFALYALLLAPLAGCDHGVEAAPPPDDAAPAGVDPIDPEWRGLAASTTRHAAQSGEGLVRNGPCTLWHAGGSKAGEGEMKDGKKTGAWTFWHENGVVRWQGTFEDDVPTGSEHAWHEDGRPALEGTLAAGKRNGAYKYWYENGKLELEAEFKDDQRHGICRHYSPDGEIDALQSGRYERGRKVGEL